MLKILTLVLFSFFSVVASAEPELTGTPSELEPFLNGIPKIVTFTATAKQQMAMSKAIVRLAVETESKELAVALQENLELRSFIKAELNKAGIPKSNIKESKFSSTPEYGFFDERPKSYKVENILAVEISDETQMIAVAALSDKLGQVQYLASKAKAEDKPSVKHALLEQAIQLAQDKAELFKSKLGLQLQAIEFQELPTEQIVVTGHRSLREKSGSTSYFSADIANSFGQSTQQVSVSITYAVLK